MWEGHQLPTELISNVLLGLDHLYNEGLPVSQDSRGRLQLIHPHSHPLIYGRTLVRERKVPDEKGSSSTFIRAEPSNRRNNFHNMHSTFLPTTFHVPSRAASSLLAESYINGIPPFPPHHILRDDILELLHRTVPLFENVLTGLHRQNYVFIRPRIRRGYKHTNAHEPPPEKPGQVPGDTTDDEQDEDAWFDYRWRLSCWEASRKVCELQFLKQRRALRLCLGHPSRSAKRRIYSQQGKKRANGNLFERETDPGCARSDKRHSRKSFPPPQHPSLILYISLQANHPFGDHGKSLG